MFQLILILLFVLIANVLAVVHAYRFTHFSREEGPRINHPDELNGMQKIKTLFTGVVMPRPVNQQVPHLPYQHVVLPTQEGNIRCWYIPSAENKGVVALFHGYGAEKSAMLPRATELHKMGFNTLLVDFTGAGASAGERTTIGFYEAEQVVTVFKYLTQAGHKRITLFGTSMGAAAIFKAQHDYQLPVSGIIAECPFGTMLQTVQARFAVMQLPAFPFANLMVFWGGTLNGFNAFNHNPADYALAVKCPVLLLHGGKDNRVSIAEIETIYRNLSGEKTLRVYPLSGHESYLLRYANEWRRDVLVFLRDLHP